MNLSFFIANRVNAGAPSGFTSVIHKIAIITIAVGLAASLVAFLVMKGFQENVKQKVFSFGGHLIITKFTLNNSVEEQPFSFNTELYNRPTDFAHVAHVQEYAHKAGLIKTDTEVLGVLLRGVSPRFDVARFQENMKEGRFVHFSDTSYSNEVVVSNTIATKLNLSVGDEVVLHFFQNPPRFRKLKICGVYQTNLSEYFDAKVILGDLKLIQRLNDWQDSIAGGLQVYIKNPEQAEEALVEIGERMDYDLYIEKTTDTYTQVFEWLGLINRQVNILMVIILTVVCVNMISVILILVMERTQMIGTLKALGARDRLIRNVFVYSGVRLVVQGLAAGNALGLGVCFLQHTLRWIRLNPYDYYISYVPIAWDWPLVVLLNLAFLAIITMILLLPAAFVARLKPIAAIKFD